MGKKALMICVMLALFLSSCAGKSDDGTKSSPSSNSSTSSSGNLGSALNLVMGSDSEASVFSSYHIDVNLDIPQLNDDSTAVVNQKTLIAADVEGKNIHILQTDPGASAQKEGYIIGDKEYKIVDGKPQEMMGQIALSWAMWPLHVVMPYAYASYWAKASGSDTLDGRKADVYDFDSSKADAASNSAMSAMGMEAMTQGKGTVWIDHETGGMLKLNMTYTENVTDSNQKVVGPGTGTITLEVSKVNQVKVTSPQ